MTNHCGDQHCYIVQVGTRTHSQTILSWSCRNFSWMLKANSIIRGSKMPTICNRGFYCRSYCLLNMFRAPLCPSSGAQEYYTVVAARGISCCGLSSSWSGVELRVMCPVCRKRQHPANRTHNPQLHTRPAT